ncbi:MAG: 2-polyprenylphenol 6-hydroxylase [Deltaproteobacteria bacterium GWC2_42_51]|nr:MAG: 2-polyprenylphenol 6-hydroxylase [Deltaproteobacteria bacterium GWA2_42_85]OGP29511.1 MAG: 2-polyprenylphenol 6-hydroxylase [Deltaproteobacteria bacterium GWB2_42_7]OGP36177.1 MAG: 2-polyprenylphenol 6-hydroxylase [Deltaproteobacteria bacterium GWC2_42_51]OGP38116.1 MAG: 2-polyprenylphenol 6-hydroxylase [Deltaproteobacteria bacterium GWD2_42_10]OGQ26184.1 MAG: 2-polyprenylphenol 6-hydroxylase [Deltaproteobacteria bacterium RIFCSPHIGHO2_02_FULL_42_44]HAG50613.1 2-polyprenylphenol 6-hydr
MQTRTYQNIRRLHRIVAILIKYGFGGLVKELKLFPFLSSFERLLFFRRAKKELSIPERIRLVLEELGPTFIKLGQVASTRADLLPPDWLEELKKLQDAVPPFSFVKVREVVEHGLKAPLHEKFKTFDEAPCASASIAQVHYAILPSGQEVAVKVKRPGIDKIIESDISVMHTIAYLLDRYVPQAKRYRAMEVVDEFARVIHKEQDFTVEGSHASRFAKMFEDDPTVKIPKVFWDYTTNEALTLERIYGTPLDETEKIKAQGLDVRKIAENGIRAFFRQVFEFGFFHADLHPGNIFASPDGTIIYLDFGIMGRLDENLRKYLASLLFYLVKQDYYSMAQVHREMGLITKEVDIHEFEDALRDICEPVFGRTLEQINMSELIMKLIRTARRFQMRLQPNLLLLQKSMVIIEGVGRQIYPDVNMWEVAKPLIYKWMLKEKASPKRIYERGKGRVENFVEMATDVPYQVHSILNRTLNEELKIGFVHHKLDVLSDEIGNLGYRIANGMIIAALVIGASLLAIANKSMAVFWGAPALSWIGFLLAGILGLRLVSKKH